MSFFEELRAASYKSVPFFVTSTDTPAGIKHVKHVFPNSSNQSIEELGLLQRTYNITAVITANAQGDGYQARRDRLLRALERGGIGTLIHPFYGRLENIKAVSWSPTETMTSVGAYSVNIVFEVHIEQTVPVSAGFSLSQVFQNVTDFVSGVITDIESNYSVINSFVSNIEDGFEQVREFASNVEDAIRIVAQSPQTGPGTSTVVTTSSGVETTQITFDKITQMNNQIEALIDDSVTLALNPDQLATDTTAIFDTIDDLYTDPSDTLEVLKRLFTFGDDDVSLDFEKVTTNQLLFSEEFDNADWQKTELTVTADNEVAPDGTTTMDLLIPTAVNTSHILLQSSSITEGTTYTQSIFAESGGYDFLQMAASNGFFTINTWVNFNLNTGAIGNSGGDGIASIENIGGEIFRCVLTVQASSTVVGGSIAIAPLNADTASRLPAFVGDTVSGVNLWGAQMEPQASASDYKMTEDEAVTDNTEFTTTILTIRSSNRDLYRQSVQGTALAYAYLNASRIDFTTVTAIEEEEAELEAQYDKVVASTGFTESTKSLLTELRIITTDFFTEQKLTVDQIIKVRTNTTSARLLSYQYYGESVTNAPIIDDLNDIVDTTFINGDLEIITA